MSEDFFITFQIDDVIETADMDVPISIKGFSYRDSSDPKVLYFEQTGILYIRLPDMDTEYISFYRDTIPKYKDKSIQKVVIDIRSNGGGNDEVWMTVLSAIIDKSIICKNKTYLKNTPLVIDYMSKIRNEQIISDQISSLNIDDNYYLERFDKDTIALSPKSIRYTGKIYVLVDKRCFSSALAFTAFCCRTDQLITVGQPSGYIGGRGTSPFFFSLPHSKLIFAISPMLDATNVESIEDYYDRFVQIPVFLTIADYVFERKYEGERYGEEYLFNYDSTFRKVLEL